MTPKKTKRNAALTLTVSVPVAGLVAAGFYAFGGQGSHTLDLEEALRIMSEPRQSPDATQAAAHQAYLLARDTIRRLKAARDQINGEAGRQINEWIRKLEIEAKEAREK